MSKATLRDANELLHEVASVIFEAANANTPSGKWKSAYLDVRGPAEGGSRILKFRITLANGRLIDLYSPTGVAIPLSKLWKMKDKVFPQEWYGLKLTVSRKGECETEFNYDADCINDESYYES
jgi:hypothetical protein